MDGWPDDGRTDDERTDDRSMDGQEMNGCIVGFTHRSIMARVADPISICHLLTHPPLIDSCCPQPLPLPFVGVATHLHPCTVSVICADTVDLLSLFLRTRFFGFIFCRLVLQCFFFPSCLAVSRATHRHSNYSSQMANELNPAELN